MNIPPRVRMLYEAHRVAQPKATRAERWEFVRDRAMDGQDMSAADHRGLAFAFDQLEREHN